MIGMNAVVMDEAEIGENLTNEELDWKRKGTATYQRLASEAAAKLKRVEAVIVEVPTGDVLSE